MSATAPLRLAALADVYDVPAVGDAPIWRAAVGPGGAAGWMFEAPAGGGSFPNPLPWQACPLDAFWRSYPAVLGDPNYEAPAYAIVGGVVFLKGVYDLQAQAGAQMPALPVGARPAHRQRLILSGASGIGTYDMFVDGSIKNPGGTAPAPGSFLVINSNYPLT